MKPKRKLKPWVKTFLLLLPEIVIVCQLFYIGTKITQIAESSTTIIINESRYCYE